MAGKPLSTSQAEETKYQFQLDVHIRRRSHRPVFQAFGKSIYEVEWIDQDGPPIILLKVDGAKANREASFYVNLSIHSHIVHTFGFVQSKPGSVMLLQERAPYGDLLEHFQDDGFKPTERVLCAIFEQISDALMFLSHNRVVHGDLACRNVLVFLSDPTEPKKNLVKLTDFGLTRGSSLYSVVDSSARTTMTIIPTRYAAPELLRDTSKLNYSEKSDVYSMGVLMWEACSYGQIPYSSLDSDSDVRRKKLNDKRLPRPSLCSDQLWNIINECWHQNPQDRPDFKTLKQYITWTSIDKNNQNSADIVQCEYCQNRCYRNDYPTHKRNCLRNRSNTNDTSSSLHNSQSEELTTSTSVVHIPCKYCKKPIDASKKWTHVKNCSQRPRKQVELIPCEFCNKLCSSEQLLTHQVDCFRNPHNRVIRDKTEQRNLTNNAYDNDTDDDAVPLLVKDKNRWLKDSVQMTRSGSLNSGLPSTERKIGRRFRLPCCPC